MENSNKSPNDNPQQQPKANADKQQAYSTPATTHIDSAPLSTANTPPSFWENNRLLIKGLTLAFLALLLMIPQLFIYDLIKERAHRKQDVIQEVSSKWASEQTITGPMIAVPYLQQMITTDKKVFTEKKYFYLMPEHLSIDGKLIPEERRRNLFNVMLYKSDMKIQGDFSNSTFEKLKIPADIIQWQEARLVVGISDYKGLQENVTVMWNNIAKTCDADFEDKSIVDKSISTPIVLSPNDLKQTLTFSMNLKLNGTGQILFVPVANNTKVHLTSSWKVPDFRGNTLASFNKDFATKGLDATWKVLGINRSFPQQWKDIKPNLNAEAFGLNLLQSIDSYAKTTRTIKYAILVILLTFAVYFFTEIYNKKWVHAVQYILIGAALVLFYTLLLSISEYVSFNAAYGIAVAATIGLIAAYTHSVFGNRKTTGLFAGFLATIYLFVFMLVQLEDTALIVGSVGLFIILAVIMYASRKVDWFHKQ